MIQVQSHTSKLCVELWCFTCTNASQQFVAANIINLYDTLLEMCALCD